jgi:hypothetical protein
VHDDEVNASPRVVIAPFRDEATSRPVRPPDTSEVIDSLASHLDDATEAIMKRQVTGDLWTDAKLLQAEERLAEARAITAQRALLRDSRPPRRGVRVWLGSVLLALGHRLLGSVPSSAGPV